MKLKGSIAAGVAWESNPLHLPPPQERRGDLRSSPAIKVEVERDIGRYGVSLLGDVGYDRYARERDLNALRLRVDGRGHMLIGGRCRAKAGLIVDRRRSDPADVGTATARYRSVDTSLSLGCPRLAGLHPQLAARLIDQSLSKDDQALYDSRTRSISADLLYTRPSLGTAGASLGYGRITRPDFSPLPSVDMYRAGARFERYIAARLGGSVAVGYARLRPENRQDVGIVEWRGDLRWLLTPDRSITASFAREARAESNVAASFVRTTKADLDLSFRLGGRSRLSARAEREWRNFYEAVPTANRAARKEDRTTRLGLQLEYRLAPTLLLDAHVTHATRAATPASYRYRSTGTGLRLRYTF